MSILTLCTLISICICTTSSVQICSQARFDTGGKAILVEERQRVSIITEEQNCLVQLRVLLVGGGGDGAAFGGNGGGSGNVVYKELEVDPSQSLGVNIGKDGNFGGAGESTSLGVYLSSDYLVEALGGLGGDDNEESGGDGYSGGGGGSTSGFAGGHGGTDGGDGEHSPFSSDGGKGSGVNIRSFQFDHFQLSPGAGGVGEYDRAGGGGGVLVEVEREVFGRRRDHGPTDGEGYGGGSGNGWANKGVAVLEII